MTLRAARLSGLREDREGKADFRMKALGSDLRRLEISRGAPEVELDYEIYLSFCRTAQQRLQANNVTVGLTQRTEDGHGTESHFTYFATLNLKAKSLFTYIPTLESH